MISAWGLPVKWLSKVLTELNCLLFIRLQLARQNRQTFRTFFVAGFARFFGA